VWLGHAGSRAWSCEQCTAQPNTRRLRGNCGGPFLEGLAWSRFDDQGRYVMGYRVAPDCGDWGEQKIRSCPVAGANRLAPLLVAYQRQRAGVCSLSDLFNAPTCAVIDLFAELHTQTELSHARMRERAAEEARHGAGRHS
jgi:hypothetical protein